MVEIKPRQLLCLTMMGYMKSGITENDLCHFQLGKHAQMVSGLMKKYGLLRYTITHNTAATRSLLPKLFDPAYVEFADHDFVVRIIFPSVDVFLALKNDEEYRQRIAMDHLNFADRQKRTKMSLGYVHEVILEGEITYVSDASETLCHYNNSTLQDGRFVRSMAKTNGMSGTDTNGVHE